MDAGPCKKKEVWCIIAAQDSDLAVKAQNLCAPSEGRCRRTDADAGKNYDKCNSYHAEEIAAQMWLEINDGNRKPAIAYITGHTYVCDKCKAALVAAGVTEFTLVERKETFDAIWEQPKKEELH